MSGGSAWLDAFMFAMLRFLAHIESWHLVAAGVAGAALCIVFGRTNPFGLIGATLCGAVALAGAANMWRSFGAPRQVAVVMARTVGAQGGYDDVRIFAKNLSNRPLTNLRAVVRSYQAGGEMKMNLVLDRQLDAGEPQTVPAGSEFALLYMIPAALDGRVSGIPAAQFVPAFGDLHFTSRYDTNQIFARLVSVPQIEQQLLRIEREDDNAAPAPTRP
jgi:hypothetical protein